MLTYAIQMMIEDLSDAQLATAIFAFPLAVFAAVFGAGSLIWGAR